MCYQIPALLREGTGIVISPLIALMQDQVAALGQLGRPGGLSQFHPLARPNRGRSPPGCAAGDLDLLYLAPERLVQGRYSRAPYG